MKKFPLFFTYMIWTSLSFFHFSFKGKQHIRPTGIHNTAKKEILGQRLKIEGYFNGQEEEMIFESYISLTTGKETSKVRDSNNEVNNRKLIALNRPQVRLYSSLGQRKYYILSNSPLQCGLALLENCGDINDDGVDEIGYMIKWLDDSQLNTYHILKFDNNIYQEILSFQVHETLSFDSERLFDNGKVFEKLTDDTITYLEYGNDGQFHEKEYFFQQKPKKKKR